MLINNVEDHSKQGLIKLTKEEIRELYLLLRYIKLILIHLSRELNTKLNNPAL